MRNYLFLLFFILPLSTFAQFVGFGYQTADFKTNQFAMSASIPYEHAFFNKNMVAVGMGVGFTTSRAKISGLNIKPISLAVATRDMVSKKNSTVLFKLDAGYNFNFAHGNNGIILTPALYADYGILYFSTGYDYNVIHNEGQLFLRVGIGITWSFLKDFARNY